MRRYPRSITLLLLFSLALAPTASFARERSKSWVVAHYDTPAVAMTDQEGVTRSLEAVLDVDGPVVFNFIFASCNAVCPVLTSAFANTRQALGADAQRIRMVSISNDPDHDTPSVLKTYAARYAAPPEWLFLSGTPEHTVAVLKAFDAYRGSKMNHLPLTYMRASKRDPWVRIEGFPAVSELADELRRMLP